MFKDFIKQSLEAENYGIISLVIFVAFFLSIAIYAWMINKDKINELKNLPLD